MRCAVLICELMRFPSAPAHKVPIKALIFSEIPFATMHWILRIYIKSVAFERGCRAQFLVGNRGGAQ